MRLGDVDGKPIKDEVVKVKVCLADNTSSTNGGAIRFMTLVISDSQSSNLFSSGGEVYQYTDRPMIHLFTS